MFNIKKYRFFSIFLFIVMVIVLMLLTITIWNLSVKEENIANKDLLFFYLFFILAICILQFIIVYRLSDSKIIDRNINDIVSKEKARLIAEYKKKDIKEEEKTEAQIDITKAVKKILQNTQNMKNLKSYTEKLLSNLSKELEIVQGLFYVKSKKANHFSFAGEYAYTGEKPPADFKLGDTLPGQAAKDKDIIIVEDIPENYLSAESGLGKSLPKNLILVPVIYKGKPVAVMELALFKSIEKTEQNILKELSATVGDKIEKFAN